MFMMKNEIKMVDLEVSRVSLFQETSIYPLVCVDDFHCQGGNNGAFLSRLGERRAFGFPVSLVSCEATTMYITSGVYSDDVVQDCSRLSDHVKCRDALT